MALNGWDVYMRRRNNTFLVYIPEDNKFKDTGETDESNVIKGCRRLNFKDANYNSFLHETNQNPDILLVNRRSFVPAFHFSQSDVNATTWTDIRKYLQQGYLINETQSQSSSICFGYSDATVSSALLERALKEEIQGVRSEMTSLTTKMDSTLGAITELVSAMATLMATKK